MRKRSVDAKRRAAQLSNSAEGEKYRASRRLRIRHPQVIRQDQALQGGRQSKLFIAKIESWTTLSAAAIVVTNGYQRGKKRR